MSNKNSILSMLISTNKRLDKIEHILKLNADKLNLIGIEDLTDSIHSQQTLNYLDDYLDNNYLDDYINIDTNKSQENNLNDGYESSDCGELILEESYESDNDKPIEKIEVYPEPKINLTSLQIQLENEQFMKYKYSNSQTNEFSDSESDNNSDSE